MSWETFNPRGRPSGWTDGLVAPQGGRIMFVAGQTARDASGKVPPSAMAAQFRQALINVLEVVGAAGGGPGDVGRMTVYVTELAAYRAARPELAGAWRELMGTNYPAMALLEVKGLLDENAVVEIEATAVLPAWKR